MSFNREELELLIDEAISHFDKHKKLVYDIARQLKGKPRFSVSQCGWIIETKEKVPPALRNKLRLADISIEEKEV